MITLKYVTFSLLLLIGSFNITLGYEIDQSNTQSITNGTTRLIEGVFKGFAPDGAKDIVEKGQNLVNVPNVSSGSFSSGDLITAVKAIITLTLNLFFVVIEVVIQILRALLSVVSSYQV